MAKNLVARSTMNVNASAERVWDALVTPSKIAKYMFGAQVESNWEVGSPIIWRGEWEGRAYEDRGVIKRIAPGRVLEYTHYSPLSGQPDLPESYHTVTIELARSGAGTTRVTLYLDNNPSEEARAHSVKNWDAMLSGLKKLVESGG